MPKSGESRVPFWCRLSEQFYRKLERYAKESGVTKEQFLKDAIESHFQGLRLGSAKLGTQIRKLAQDRSKAWWNKLTEEEKRARAMKAVEGRQAKRKRQKEDHK